MLTIFLNVVTPVFALVLMGYLVGPRLQLETRTLSRIAYFLFVPAFVFNHISQANVSVDLTVRMVAYMGVVHVACAGLGLGVARLLGRSWEMAAAYALIAVFGNVGNFGLSMIEFRLGEEAVVAGTIYFLAILVIAFIIGVAAASGVRRGGIGAVLAIFKTPALLATLPAAIFPFTGTPPPLFLARIAGLLSGAMIPVMLVTLGVQLAEAGKLQVNLDTIVASSVKLVGGPILATILVFPFGLIDPIRAAGILQASMPTAVLATIIAMEHNLLPEFVTTATLFSTLASLLTLTLVLSYLV